MKKFVILYFFLFTALISKAQGSSDTLAHNRGIFISTAYKNGIIQENRKLHALYKKNGAFKSMRLLKNHQIMLPVGAVVSTAGVVIGVNALIGTKHSQVIDGTEYFYYKRPVMQVLAGLGMLAAGIVTMELGNDAKIKSLKRYNNRIHSAKTTVGVFNNGNAGIKLEF